LASASSAKVATKTSARIAANSVTQSERMAIDTFHVTVRFPLFLKAYLHAANANQLASARIQSCPVPASYQESESLERVFSGLRRGEGRNTAELNISTSKELSRTLVCKGQSVVRVAADARVRLSDLPVPRFAGPDTKRARISIFHTPAAPIAYMWSSQRPGLNECSKPLYAQGRASSAVYGNRLVSGFAYLARPWRLIPPLRCRLLVVSVVMDQCVAAVPNAPMKHLGCYPLTNHDGDHHEQHGNHDEDKKCSLECRVSPSLVTSSTQPLRVGRRADRLLDLGSLGPAIHPPDWLRKGGGQSNRVFPYAQFRASPAGLSRSPTPQRTGDRTPKKVW
jgi:hypothetical protein